MHPGGAEGLRSALESRVPGWDADPETAQLVSQVEAIALGWLSEAERRQARVLELEAQAERLQDDGVAARDRIIQEAQATARRIVQDADMALHRADALHREAEVVRRQAQVRERKKSEAQATAPVDGLGAGRPVEPRGAVEPGGTGGGARAVTADTEGVRRAAEADRAEAQRLRHEAERVRRVAESQAAAILQGARREAERLVSRAEKVAAVAAGAEPATEEVQPLPEEAEQRSAAMIADAEARATAIVAEAEDLRRQTQAERARAGTEIEALLHEARVRAASTLEEAEERARAIRDQVEVLVGRVKAEAGGHLAAAEQHAARLREEAGDEAVAGARAEAERFLFEERERLVRQKVEVEAALARMFELVRAEAEAERLLARSRAELEAASVVDETEQTRIAAEQEAMAMLADAQESAATLRGLAVIVRREAQVDAARLLAEAVAAASRLNASVEAVSRDRRPVEPPAGADRSPAIEEPAPAQPGTGLAVLETPLPASTAPPNVLFLCQSGLGTSSALELLVRRRIREIGVEADLHAAGLSSTDGRPMPSGAMKALRKRGVRVRRRRGPTPSAELLDQADVVLVAASSHAYAIFRARPELAPRVFTVKELIRRGEARGGRHSGEPFPGWLARMHAGRAADDRKQTSLRDDIVEPDGAPTQADYDWMMEELDQLAHRLVVVMWAPDGRT